MSKLRALWRNGRGLLFVVLVGIAFYEMLEHFSSVRAVISRTTSVLMPKAEAPPRLERVNNTYLAL